MRVVVMLLLPALAPFTAGAQTARSPDAPGIEVVKFSWNKERIGWERDPFNGPVENFHEMQVRSRSEKRVNDAKRSGNSAEVNRLERDARVDAVIIASQRRQGPPRYTFLYKIAVRNTSGKAIKEFDWDYLFFDAATGEELGRRQFASAGKVAPGKRKEFDFLVPTPPAQKISAHALDKRERDGLTEKVVVVRVVYEDGTVWQP